MFSHPLLTLFSAPGSAGTAGPINTAIPVISGVLTTGETLTTTDGEWLNSPTSFTYQWQRDGVDISAATANAYILVGVDANKTITAIVTADGSVSATSAGVVPIASYTDRVLALSPAAYWPLAEASGTIVTDESGNAHGGTYSGVALGAPGIGDGRTAASFNGTSSYAVVFSGDLLGGFDGQEGTFECWIKVGSAGVWSDGTVRIFVRFLADGTNYAQVYKNVSTGVLTFEYAANGVFEIRSSAAQTSVNFIHIAMTWSVSADQLKCYINGIQEGATLTGLGAWAGDPYCVLGNSGAGTTADGWIGRVAHAAVWKSALSAAQIAALAGAP